jgi:hypothetical protein
MTIGMLPLPSPLRIIHTPADDIRDVPAVSGVANAAILFEITLYASPFLVGTHFRDLALNT